MAVRVHRVVAKLNTPSAQVNCYKLIILSASKFKLFFINHSHAADSPDSQLFARPTLQNIF